MMNHILPNIFAMVSSFLAVCLLAFAIPRVGGSLGRVLKFLGVGIFFSDFAHAAVELAHLYGFLGDPELMTLMGVLLTVGSGFFLAAGVTALRSLQ